MHTGTIFPATGSLVNILCAQHHHHHELNPEGIHKAIKSLQILHKQVQHHMSYRPHRALQRPWACV